MQLQVHTITYCKFDVKKKTHRIYLAFLLDINECNMNMCMNGGTCVDTIGSYYCKCDQGWEGVQCEISQYHCLKVGIFAKLHNFWIICSSIFGFGIFLLQIKMSVMYRTSVCMVVLVWTPLAHTSVCV